MRTIKVRLPRDAGQVRAIATSIPVMVGWPELTLSLDQIAANAVARAFGEDPPFEDTSIIEVLIEWQP